MIKAIGGGARTFLNVKFRFTFQAQGCQHLYGIKISRSGGKIFMFKDVELPTLYWKKEGQKVKKFNFKVA